MGYSVATIRKSVESLASIGIEVKVIDDHESGCAAIVFPHVHSGSVDVIATGNPDAWQKAIDTTARERKMMGPCLCMSPPITVDDVAVSSRRGEWGELIADIKSGNIGSTIPTTSEVLTLQYYSCSRALTNGRYSGLTRDITEKHGQWYVRVMKSAPLCTGDWRVFSLQADAEVGGEQSIIVRSTSAQSAAEKAETILTAISLCF